LDLSTKNRAVPTVSAIVALLVDLMNDQVFSLQREGIAANLPRPFRRVESSRRSMKDFWEQRFYSLPFVATSQRYLIKRALLNLSSLRLIPSSLAYSKSCRYKLDLHKFIAFVRQLSGRSLVNLDKTNNSRSVLTPFCLFRRRYSTVQLLAFVNIADYILHCTKINSFELGNSTGNRFDGNHFLLSRRLRAEHMKSEKCQSCFSRQKFTP